MCAPALCRKVASYILYLLTKPKVLLLVLNFVYDNFYLLILVI